MSTVIPIVPTTVNPIQNVITQIPPFTLWLYKILAVFPLTGFTGIDHWALGSQFTGFAKLFVNVLTLGSWYAYDIVQVYNTHNLRDKGLKFPFLESGSIGKGRIDDLPSKSLKENEKKWLYLLVTLAFGLLYFISTFFLHGDSGFLSTSFRYFSGGILLVTVGLAVFTIFSFMQRNPLFIPVNGTPTQSLQNLYAQTGVQNPALGKTSQFGGDLNLNDLRTAASTIMMQNGGAKSSQNESIYFISLLALLPITGFLAFYLKRNSLNK